MPPPELGRECARIDRVLAAASDIVNAVHGLVVQRPRIPGRPEGHVVAARSKALSDLDQVLLRSTGFGMLQVPPVEQEQSKWHGSFLTKGGCNGTEKVPVSMHQCR